MDIYKAIKVLKEERKENPKLKLFRVLLDGVSGVKVDDYTTAETLEGAIATTVECACSMKPNDFDKMGFEVDIKPWGG